MAPTAYTQLRELDAVNTLLGLSIKAIGFIPITNLITWVYAIVLQRGKHVVRLPWRNP